jgi:hypothetical protein
LPAAVNFPIIGSTDGPRITINDYLKDPLRIPAMIMSMMRNEFIIDAVLRDAGNNESGAVRYEQSTPLYADHDPDIRAEFAEVRAVSASVGPLNVAYSYERALAIQVSDAMRRRQIVDPVNRQLTQVKNSMVRSWNVAFFTLLDSLIPAAQKIAIPAAEAWDGAISFFGAGGGNPPVMGTNATITGNIIRAQLSDAVWLVENAASALQPNNFFGFEPDTMIIDHTAKLALFKSADFAKPYIGDAASDSILYTGLMPRKILNMDVLVSRQCTPGNIYICQRNTLGFISDELPTTASPLYRDEPRKTWRSDVQRASAMGLDQPQAIAVLTGATTVNPPTGLGQEI